MTDKQDIIRQMIEMQKKFISREQASGIEPGEYYDPESGSEFDGYQGRFNDLANQLVDIAHAEKGSRR